MIEPFNVTGTGKQGRIRVQTDNLDNEVGGNREFGDGVEGANGAESVDIEGGEVNGNEFDNQYGGDVLFGEYKFDDDANPDEEEEEEENAKWQRERWDILYPLNVIDRAYIPSPIMSNLDALRTIFKNLRSERDSTRPRRRSKDSKKGFTAFSPRDDSESVKGFGESQNAQNGLSPDSLDSESTPTPLWQFTKHLLSTKSTAILDTLHIQRLTDFVGDSAEIMYGAESVDNAESVGSARTERRGTFSKNEGNIIEMRFNPSHFGLVENGNSFAFIDGAHREEFMQRINGRKYLSLQQRFRVSNTGMFGI